MSGRAALAFALANAAAGALNYVFQVYAVAILDDAAFGALSTWLARVTVAASIAPIAQFVSMDHLVADRTMARASRAAVAVAAVALALHLALGTRLSPVALGATAIASNVLFLTAIGQLQGKLRLAAAAAAVLAAASFRLVPPIVAHGEATAHVFFVAHATAGFAGLLVAGLFADVGAIPAARSDDDTGAPRLALGRPVLLAFATMLFPLLDVLVVSSRADAATTGAFSRMALPARVVFFGGAAVLQVLLPHWLAAAKRAEPPPPFVRTAERALGPATLGGALALAFTLDVTLLRAAGDERVWLYASCVGAALLVLVLGHVQRFAARGELRSATLVASGVLVAALVAAVAAISGGGEHGDGDRGAVTTYVATAAFLDAVVLALATIAQRRSRGGRPDVASGA